MQRRSFLKSLSTAIAGLAASGVSAQSNTITVTPQGVVDDFFAVRSSIENMPLREIKETLAPNVIRYVNGLKLTDLQAYNLAEFMVFLHPENMMRCWCMMAEGPVRNTILLHCVLLADGRVFSHVLVNTIKCGDKRERCIQKGYTEEYKRIV